MTDLIIIGGSTAFNEVLGIIEGINKVKDQYRVVGILDDNEQLYGTKKEGVPVLGDISTATKYKNEVKFVFGIGSMITRLNREKILLKTGLTDDSFETL
ncbi:MAG: hypothetical protein O2887_10235, partial [Bacteroidetes bacterium]|nr:hypothetical protein [Bacteroidota bacterium]